MAFLPTTVMIFAPAQAATRLLPRLGPKPLLVAGIAVTIVGMLWLAQVSTATTYLSGLLGPLLFGLGDGAAVRDRDRTRPGRGPPAGLRHRLQPGHVTQQVGGSLGLVILVTVFGTASRNAAAHPLVGLSPQAQAILAQASAAPSPPRRSSSPARSSWP